MNQKSALKNFSFNKSKEKLSLGFIGIPVLVMIVLTVTLAATAKSIYDKSHVLGQSTMLAETPPQGGTPPPPPSSDTPPAPPPAAPPPQSAPPPPPPSSGTPPPPTSGGTPPPPSTQSAPPPSYSGSGTPPPPTQTQQYQQTQQQYNQSGTSQKTGGQQQYGNQQGSNYSGQNASSNQYNPNQYNQGGTNQGSQTGNSNSTQGQFGGGQNDNQQNQRPQTISPQDQQKYQQMQQQYQQEAAKYGFKISGDLPTQYFQQQQNSQGNQNSGNNQDNSQRGGPNSQSGSNLRNFLQALPPANSFPSIQGNFNVSSANGGAPVNLNSSDTRVRLGSDLRAIRSDGTQTQIDKKALEQINTAIKVETGSEISQSGDTLTLKRGSVEATTKFPIAFNIATKTFTVQTSSGEKEVKVLPDQAVQKLLENKVISQLQTNTTTSAPTVTLTELDNQPVYEVQGTNQKKFLGLLPVSISKTTYVSAETGDAVKTDTSTLSKILETISF